MKDEACLLGCTRVPRIDLIKMFLERTRSLAGAVVGSVVCQIAADLSLNSSEFTAKAIKLEDSNLAFESESTNTNTNTIFIIAVAVRSAVASPNMSTTGNRTVVLCTPQTGVPHGTPPSLVARSRRERCQSGRRRRRPYPRH
jgi:hypothetical protein